MKTCTQTTSYGRSLCVGCRWCCPVLPPTAADPLLEPQCCHFFFSYCRQTGTSSLFMSRHHIRLTVNRYRRRHYHSTTSHTGIGWVVENHIWANWCSLCNIFTCIGCSVSVHVSHEDRRLARLFSCHQHTLSVFSKLGQQHQRVPVLVSFKFSWVECFYKCWGLLSVNYQFLLW